MIVRFRWALEWDCRRKGGEVAEDEVVGVVRGSKISNCAERIPLSWGLLGVGLALPFWDRACASLAPRRLTAFGHVT